MSLQKFTLRQKIANLFTKHKSDTPKQYFENTAKTDKGMDLYYDELVAGQPIFQKDPEGMLVAAPEGEHVLEDGTKIMVEIMDEGGMQMSIIKEVISATGTPDPNATPDTNALNDNPTAAADAAAKTRIRSIIEEVRFTVDPDLSLEDTVQAFKEHIKVLQDKVTENETKAEDFKKIELKKDEEIQKLQEALIEFEKPAAPVTHVAKRSKFLKGIEEDKNDGVDRYAANLKKLRNLNK